MVDLSSCGRLIFQRLAQTPRHSGAVALKRHNVRARGCHNRLARRGATAFRHGGVVTRVAFRLAGHALGQYTNRLPELSLRGSFVKLSSLHCRPFAAAVSVPSCSMGFMRFLVPSDERLRDEAVQRAYLMGMDYVPWASQASWDGQVLTVEREVRESGMLAIPWTVPGHGEYILQTTSLVERRQPYLLQLELALTSQQSLVQLNK